MDIAILKTIVDSPELLEVGRKAIEDTLVSFRDDRLAVLGNNGLVIKERDGTPSDIIRLGTEHALKIGLEAIITHLKDIDNVNYIQYR